MNLKKKEHEGLRAAFESTRTYTIRLKGETQKHLCYYPKFSKKKYCEE